MGILLITAIALATAAGPGAELAVNGSFEQPAPDGRRPDGWSLSGNTQWLAENGNHFIRIRDSGTASQSISLQPDWWKIEVSVRVRCSGVVRGKESWYDARVAMMFADDQGNRVGDWPNVLNWTGTFDWRRESRTFIIPRGATKLQLSCAMFSTTGITDFDDLSVKLIALWPKPEDAAPPLSVDQLWDSSRAWQQESKTRGRLCINGLWQFYPAQEDSDEPPPSGAGWGWIAVPGNWLPGSGTVVIGPDIWEAEGHIGPQSALKAWYRRRVTLPAAWKGRDIFINIDNPSRSAAADVNGRSVGSVNWPGGRLRVTDAVSPGREAEIAILVDALPVPESEWQKKTLQEQREMARQVRVRGLCGDVFLEAEPPSAVPHFGDVLMMPSVRKRALGVRFSLLGGQTNGCVVEAEARDQEGKVVQRWGDVKLAPGTVQDGRAMVWLQWPNPKLWDVRRPYFCTVVLRLRQRGNGEILDETLPIRLGFREFWIDGRKAILNGHPVHLRAFDLTNTGSDGGLASETACEWTLRRFAEVGMNFVYLSHYELDWGQVQYLQGIIEAADRLGMLVSLPMPHPRTFASDFNPDTGEPRPEYWERMAQWIAQQAGNHPSVIMYAMSHNSLGHEGDQNPRVLDASFPEFDERLPSYLLRFRRVARWAEDYVSRLDPTRIVYHHQCGNFGPWYTINCYLNWVPIQNRMDWLSQYYHAGRKPLFLVEFGMPHHASFQRHRGAPFIWRNEVHAEPLCIEWAARLFGDQAYELREENVELYDVMARVYERKGPKFYFWEVFSRPPDHGYMDVIGEYSRYTWPAFRTWELAAVGPWDWNDCGRVEAHRVELKTNWADLQRPGFHPAYVDVRSWYDQPPSETVEWTAYGQALLRYNQDLLAYIAGKPAKFTSLDHIFEPGERVQKQIVLINDTSTPQTFDCQWTVVAGGRRIAGGREKRTVPAGEVVKVPVGFTVPAMLGDAAGQISLTATVNGQTGDNLRDRFDFRVVAVPKR
ncbi:MAG: hypothetical protein H5T86_05150, partial [Armatimonadetes bacterium]|nr:hypothetical protein [Armatimonadota bacterium]